MCQSQKRWKCNLDSKVRKYPHEELKCKVCAVVINAAAGKFTYTGRNAAPEQSNHLMFRFLGD